jgi:hypothetical protein
MTLRFCLINCSLLAVMLSVCVWLFLKVKRDLRVIEMRYIRRDETLRAKLEELAGEVETVRREMELIEHRSDSIATVSRALGSGVRIQALRMIKLGEAPEIIAGALGVPRTEVDLLIKVQRLLASQPPQAVP